MFALRPCLRAGVPGPFLWPRHVGDEKQKVAVWRIVQVAMSIAWYAVERKKSAQHPERRPEARVARPPPSPLRRLGFDAKCRPHADLASIVRLCSCYRDQLGRDCTSDEARMSLKTWHASSRVACCPPRRFRFSQGPSLASHDVRWRLPPKGSGMEHICGGRLVDELVAGGPILRLLCRDALRPRDVFHLTWGFATF